MPRVLAVAVALAGLLALPNAAVAFPWSEPEVVAQGHGPLLKIGPGDVELLAYSVSGGGAELRTRGSGGAWSAPETAAEAEAGSASPRYR